MIPPEIAKKIIENIIPDKKDHIDKVYKVYLNSLPFFFLKFFWLFQLVYEN